MAKQAIPLLGGQDFVVFVVCIVQLSTCATRTLTVLSVGYGWQSPFQEVDDFFEIIDIGVWSFFIHNVKPDMGIALRLSSSEAETAGRAVSI